MNNNRRSFWLSLCLINLCLVALFGFTLRSKILFPLPFIDFRHLESAHSHFAFAGWVGLSLITLFIYDLLPQGFSEKKIYQWILAGIEISSLGMALLFPLYGYNALTIFFSSLYVGMVLVFAPVFIKDVLKTRFFSIKLLSISALVSLLLSFSGTIGLTYIIVTGKGASLLYRDSIYTFLHFQYNGFFTLAVFALFIQQLIGKGIEPDKNTKSFSIFLCLSIVPSLFLSLLWHNMQLFYVLAAIGCFCILASLFFFMSVFRRVRHENIFHYRLAKTFWIFSSLSFCLKMLLHTGTIFPQLGDLIYGDRPVIIGFLHLVFLGFVSFYILALLIESGYFTKHGKIISLPFLVFASGIITNEFLLMLQGLGILFKTNNDMYKWLLWGASILLFTGAVLIALARLRIVGYQNKKP